MTHRLHAGLAPSHYAASLSSSIAQPEMTDEREEESWITFARAFLQLVHAFGVTESGTFRRRPPTPPPPDARAGACVSAGSTSASVEVDGPITAGLELFKSEAIFNV